MLWFRRRNQGAEKSLLSANGAVKTRLKTGLIIIGRIMRRKETHNMNSTKQARVDAIRSNTAYPVYRGVIGIISIIMMILAGLEALGALITGLSVMRVSFFGGFFALLIGLALAALSFFMARFWNEASLILADIGDAVMETSASAAPVAPPAYPIPTAY